MYSKWNVLNSMWAVSLWVECSLLQCTVCGSYCTAGGKCYCGFNGCVTVKNKGKYTAQQVDSCILC